MITFRQFIRAFLIVIAHLMAWVAYVGLPHFMYNLPLNHFNYKFRLIEIGLAISFFYLCYYVLVPKLIMKKRVWLFGLIVACSLLLSNYIGQKAAPHFPAQEQVTIQFEGSNDYGIQYYGEQRSIRTPPPLGPDRARMLSFSMLLIFAVSTSASLAVHYYKQEKLQKETQKEKLTGELQFLKSQINPHFLFNVLNNMYSLSLKKSDLLPDVILKLSGMMRYMLYESEDKQVQLTSEITYLDNYIDLQKLRLLNNVDISVMKEGNFENKFISPMLLIPFVENIFKHGITHDTSSYIFIYIKLDGDTLIFKTDNPFTGHKAKDKASGIGIQNVRRRLELIYPQRHSLQTEILNGRYIATLVLQLPTVNTSNARNPWN